MTIPTYGLYANEGETAVVNRLAEFSVCGYRGGGVAIADAPVSVTVRPQSGDDTKQIQTPSILSRPIRPTPTVSGGGAAWVGRFRFPHRLLGRAEWKRGEGQIVWDGAGGRYAVRLRCYCSRQRKRQLRRAKRYNTCHYHGVHLPGRFNSRYTAAGYSVANSLLFSRTPNQFWIDDRDGTVGWTPSGYNVEYERYIAAILAIRSRSMHRWLTSFRQVRGGRFTSRQ